MKVDLTGQPYLQDGLQSVLARTKEVCLPLGIGGPNTQGVDISTCT
jgi:hypothetical protein